MDWSANRLASTFVTPDLPSAVSPASKANTRDRSKRVSLSAAFAFSHRARARRRMLKLAEGEVVGEVGLYQLVPGRHDRELPRLKD